MVRIFSRSKSKKSDKPARPKKASGKKRVSAKFATPKIQPPAALEKVPVSAAPATRQSPTAKPRGKREMTPERELLIRQALMVHATQSKVLDDLDDDLKERLRNLAEEMLLGEDGTKH